MKCIVCEKDFEGRADAKFCSAKCRVKYNRQNKESKNISTRVKAQEKPKCPEYMDANQYKRWEENEFKMCKFGECLDKDCRFRV